MKPIKKILITLLLTFSAANIFAQPQTTAESFYSRGVQMYEDKNFAGCIDMMTSAKNYGMADEEKADLYIALSHKDRADEAVAFLDKYPTSQFRHIVLCHIADFYLGEENNALTALNYYDYASIEALNDFLAGDVSLHKGVAQSQERYWDKAKAMFSSLLGTRHNNEANFYLGYIAFCQRDLKSAAKYFETVNPGQTRPTKDRDCFLSQIYYLQKNFAKASQTSSKVLKSSSLEEAYYAEMLRVNGESAYNLGQHQVAVETLKKFESIVSDAPISTKYILGEDAYISGNYPAVIKYLTPVVKDDSEMGQAASLLLGQAYIHSGKHDSALIALRKAYEMTFNEGLRETALYNYGVAKMKGGKMPFGNSVATFEKFLKEYPNSRYSPEVQQYIIQGYISDNNYEAALSSINALSSPTEETMKAKQLILYTLGCRALNSPVSDSATLNYAVGKLREAKTLSQYGEEIATECDLWIGEALYRQGNYEQAIKSYKSYIAIASKTASNRITAYYDLGYAQFGKKDFTAAYSSFSTYIAGNSVDAVHKADAINRMGDCLYYKSEFENAAKMYDRAFDTNPAAGDYALFQKAVMKGLRRQHTEKVAGLEDMMNQFPNSGLYPAALLEMAEAYQEIGKTDKTVETYNTLVRKYPDTAQGRQGLLLLAITYLNGGNRDNAVATYKKLISQYPTSEEAKVATEDLKRIYTEESAISEFFAFLRTVENAPSIDRDEMERLTFVSAENLYNKNGDIGQILAYLKDYPTGEYAAQALMYQTQDFARKGDDVAAKKTAQKIITDFPHSAVAEDAYIALATAQTDLGMSVEALETYRTLEKRASGSVVLNTARLGILRTARDLGYAEVMLEAADNLLASSTVGANSREEVLFAKGVALEQLGRGDEAVECWTELSADLSRIYGTKAAFYLSQHYYNADNMSQARLFAEKIIDENPPHQYWVARTFILLSDINRREGNTFEADEYLKLLRDNYPGSEPDIFTMIEDRLNGHNFE